MQVQTTTPDQPLLFQQQADTFQLTLTYLQPQLTLTLKDLVDWKIYQKKYTNEDIGKEIDRRMDLIDVYAVFAQTVCCDQVEMKEKGKGNGTGGLKKLRRYQFGTVIEMDGVPCYKVQRGGRVTVFWEIPEKKIKKRVIYQSKLVLEKVRDLTEMETFIQKSSIQKRTIFQQLTLQLQTQSSQKQTLLQKIALLQQQNIKLKQDQLALKQELHSQLTLVKKQQLDSHNLIKGELRDSAVMVARNREEIQGLFGELKGEIGGRLDGVSQRCLDQISQLKLQLKSAKAQAKLMNFPQLYIGYFQVKDFQVRYITSTTWTQYVFNYPIYYTQVTKFRIKVIKTQNKQIMIGVIDYLKQKDSRYSYNSNNAMCYHGPGSKYPSGSGEGGGYSQGDIIEVEVNRPSATIKYMVNGTLKATDSNSMLSDNSRAFMAYVEMYRTDDVVQWQLEGL